MSDLKPVHNTLEPNEENSDAVATTLYFDTNADDSEVWASVNRLLEAGELCGWEDSEGFELVATKLQPFPAYTRWQVHPA